jgi:hypothetical protein
MASHLPSYDFPKMIFLSSALPTRPLHDPESNPDVGSFSPRIPHFLSEQLASASDKSAEIISLRVR